MDEKLRSLEKSESLKKLKSLEELHFPNHATHFSKGVKLLLVRTKLFFRYLSVVFFLKGKRFFDILFSLSMIFLTSPVMLITAVAILIESGFPIFFSQKRMREENKVFSLLKFRSMCIDAEEKKKELLAQNEVSDGVIFKMKNDPRITRVGKFIRRYSIDELPQLFNILKGDMTLVGPRPPLEQEMKAYSIDDRKRLHVKPGLTGLWQVSGRSDTTFQKQVHLDESYIRSGSLKKDFIILLKTIPAVFKGRGSY